jgi:hypothetical protein
MAIAFIAAGIFILFGTFRHQIAASVKRAVAHRSHDLYEIPYKPTRNTAEPCPACAAECSECGGKGEHTCRRMGCGGRGYIVTESKWCDAPGCAGETGKRNPGCTECHGTGEVVKQSQVCPVCHGRKIQPCGVCLGTGEDSTGKLYGARVIPLRFRKPGAEMLPPDCPDCKGTGLKQRESTPEELAQDSRVSQAAERIRLQKRKSGV